MQNAEEDAVDIVNKINCNEEEEDCQEPFAVLGEKASGNLMKMNAVENLLHSIGWTKTKLNTESSKFPKFDDINHSHDWNSVLEDKKNEILASRADTCTSNPMPDTAAPLSARALVCIKAYLNQLKI